MNPTQKQITQSVARGGSENQRSTVMGQNNAAQINAQVADTATRRAIRTLLQFVVALILSGAFDAVVKKYTDYAPAEWRYVLTGAWLYIVVQAQNWAENQGYIPPILKTKANVKTDTI